MIKYNLKSLTYKVIILLIKLNKKMSYDKNLKNV